MTQMRRRLAEVRQLRAALALILVCAAPVEAQQSVRPAPAALIPLPARVSIAPTTSCAALTTQPAAEAQGIAFRVVSASEEPARPDRAAVCLVKGYAAPQTQFELRLPMAGYTGRYLQGGCGGMCGVIFDRIAPSCSNAHAFSGAFAVAFENGGHVGAGIGDGTWAQGDPELRAQFAHKAAHAVAVVSKAIITRFYGSAPARSYFVGCSNGGREALKEAQLYPHDFDGIVAGSSVSMPAAMQRFIWEARNGLTGEGREIFTPAAVLTLHQAVLKACDGLDGVKDGQIDDPRACRFDPAMLLCRPRAAARDCLTPRQVTAARNYYQGPVDASGRHLFPGGAARGSELQWTGPAAFTQGSKSAAESFIRDILRPAGVPADMTWQSWRFDMPNTISLLQAGELYDAADPDLRPFRDAGGKLLMWQGAADNSAGLYGMLDYYQAVRDRVGGLAAARAFNRLYLVPGVYHCRGGYIAYDEDFLGAVVNWVEADRAPDAIIATATLTDGTVRRRPLYAYPTRARYIGGDVNAASSFAPRAAATEPDDAYDWPGSRTAKRHHLMHQDVARQ